MSRCISCTVLILLISSFSFGQSAPKFSNEFLSIGVGARGLGMAGTQTSLAGDATAGYWNPAGLLNSSHRYDVSLMHAEYFAGIAKFDYAAFTTPIDSVSQLGFSVIRFAIDDIPDTRFLYDANGAINYDRIRFFTAADYAFLVSYARKLPIWKGLQLGANFKVIHRIAGDFANAWGFGLDAGARLDINNWKFGVMIQDITGTFNAWTHNPELVLDVYTQTGNQIPENSLEITLPKMTMGVARSFTVKEDFGILAALDIRYTFDGKRNVLLKSDFASLDPRMGLELDYKKIVFLRMGAGNVQEVKDFDSSTSMAVEPTFGLGVQLKQFRIDYALTDIGDQSESLYSHVFSLNLGFE